MKSERNWKIETVLIIGFLLMWLMMAVVPASGDYELPPRTPVSTPSSGLPTRPALPTVTVPPSSPSTTEFGGQIHLTVDDIQHLSTQQQIWTQIEWLAEDGHWYTVDGWQGHLMEDSTVQWYVGSELVGNTASFRWRVFSYEKGVLLATSDVFHMPEDDNNMVQIIVSLPLID